MSKNRGEIVKTKSRKTDEPNRNQNVEKKKSNSFSDPNSRLFGLDQIDNDNSDDENEVRIFFAFQGHLSKTSSDKLSFYSKPLSAKSIPQYPSSHLQNYSTSNSARLEFPTDFYQYFDPRGMGIKNGLDCRESNPRPLLCKSPDLTLILQVSPTIIKIFKY